jgi:hypothetical protein
MSFLKFLKRDKSDNLELSTEDEENLDVPPLPPHFDSRSNQSFPEMPEFPKSDKIFSDIEEKPAREPKFPEVKEDIKPEDSIEEKIPPAEEPVEHDTEEQKAPLFPKPLFGTPFLGPKMDFDQQEAEVPKARLYKEPENENIQKPVLKGYEVKKNQIFIRVNDYRCLLQDLKILKKDLKKVDDSISVYTEAKEGKFEKWKSTLNDLHNKINCLDKTIFKR